MEKKFKPFILNSSLPIDRSHIQTHTTFMHTINGDISNSYNSFSFIKFLYSKFVKIDQIPSMYFYDFSKSQQDIEFINHNCSHLFIMLDNFLSCQRDRKSQITYKKLRTFLDKINIPVIALNLGVYSEQGYDIDICKKLDKSKVHFLKYLASEKVKSIGVNGFFTAEIMQKLKINNFMEIGTPSFFENGPNKLFLFDKQRNLDISNKKILLSSINCPIEDSQHFETLLSSESELIKILYFKELIPINYKLSKNYKLDSYSLMNRKYRTFSNMYKMKEYVQKFDLMLGTNVQMTILALNCNVVSFIIGKDSVSKETSQFFNIPYFPDYLDKQNLKYVFKQLDYSEMNKRYNCLYNNFANWLLKYDINILKIDKKHTNSCLQPILNINSQLDIVSNLLAIIENRSVKKKKIFKKSYKKLNKILKDLFSKLHALFLKFKGI